jgi:hypothetical protein
MLIDCRILSWYTIPYIVYVVLYGDMSFVVVKLTHLSEVSTTSCVYMFHHALCDTRSVNLQPILCLRQ